MFNAGYTDDELTIVLDKKEVEQMIDGKPVMVSADRHMINRATTNPYDNIFCRWCFWRRLAWFNE